MKMLVADDDAISRFLLQELLAPYGEVHSCVDGAEAVQAFRRSLDQGSRYELICLDIMMPNMNGVETLQQIREADQRSGARNPVKVVMTTALNDSKNIVQAFKEQCDGYLVKPIQKARLIESLRSQGLI